MPTTNSHPLAEMRQGWVEFRSRPWVVAIVVTCAISNVGVGAFLAVLGPLAAESWYAGATTWAILTTATAAGTILGAAVAVRLRPRRPLVIASVALGGMSAPMAGMALGWHIAVVALLGVAAGISLDVAVVLWDTSLQSQVPADVLSRVSAFDWFGTFALAPLAIAVAGPATNALGLTTTLACAAVATAVPILALSSYDVRQFTARTSLGEP